MSVSSEDFNRAIPAYLSAADKEALVKALKDFPQYARSYYYDVADKDALQGDVWTKFSVYDFVNQKVVGVRGIIISNSCDISPDNKRFVPARISFATLLSFNKYENMLLANGIDFKKVQSHLREIKEQKITSMFYLPERKDVHEEMIALFQDLHSTPLEVFEKNPDKKRISSLSQFGFYLLLFKISINFCRFMEGVNRGSIENGNSQNLANLY